MGWLGARLGVVLSVVATEGATTALILAILPLSLTPALALLPLVGVMLNGTSSVLYGTIPEFVTAERRTHAFAVFYTGGSIAGATQPVPVRPAGDLSACSRRWSASARWRCSPCRWSGRSGRPFANLVNCTLAR